MQNENSGNACGFSSEIQHGVPIVDTNCMPGLIILAETGVYYTNQVAGVACFHPVVEGYFVPFYLGYKNWRELRWELEMLGDSIGTWLGLTTEDADKLDSLFEKYEVPLRVERSLLESSYEAWVYVRILDLERCGVRFEGVKERSLLHDDQPLAVLVYENSD